MHIIDSIDNLYNCFENYEVDVPVVSDQGLLSCISGAASRLNGPNSVVSFWKEVTRDELKQSDELIGIYKKLQNNYCRECGRFTWTDPTVNLVVSLYFATSTKEPNKLFALGAVAYNETDECVQVDWAWMHPYMRNRKNFKAWCRTKLKDKPIFLSPPATDAADYAVRSAMRYAPEEVTLKALNIGIAKVERDREVNLSIHSIRLKGKILSAHNCFCGLESLLYEEGRNSASLIPLVDSLFKMDKFFKYLEREEVTSIESCIECLKQFIPLSKLSACFEIVDQKKYDKAHEIYRGTNEENGL